ncbi:MAG: DUF2807 domain-containing protein [Bacteroidales bacterium]|nr:DUF2807 domain-containing protein [Bacteroidales bacterium]
MKKIFLLVTMVTLASFGMGLILSFANKGKIEEEMRALVDLGEIPSEADNATVKTIHQCSDFTGLDIDKAFTVYLTIGDSFYVETEVSGSSQPYLVVECKNNILHITLEKKNQLTLRNQKLIAKITMPRLTYLKLQSASSLTCNDHIALGMDKFYASLSGASSIKNLNVDASKCEMELSGASNATFNGTYGELDIKLSGASKISFNGEAMDLEAELSGASSAAISGNFDEVDVECNGASKAEFSGKTTELEAESNGASTLRAFNMETINAQVKLSGASRTEVSASSKLEAKVTGASKCIYKDSANLSVTSEVDKTSQFVKK